MRAPRRKRPIPPDTDLDSLSETVRYVGSPEHKDIPSFAGNLAYVRMRRVVRATLPVSRRWQDGSALRSNEEPRALLGKVRSQDMCGIKHGDTVFEGRLVNRGNGSYKGYLLASDEWPDEIELKYGAASD